MKKQKKTKEVEQPKVMNDISLMKKMARKEKKRLKEKHEMLLKKGLQRYP